MPFLTRSGRVPLVSIAEAPGEGANALADYLRWHGIRPEVRWVVRTNRSIAELLASSVREAEADLLVMGAHGHSRMREIIFGGCTQAFIRNAETAVLFAH
jgi:nucleotide-binding universal stress UspA family protein